jgi:hypothetical protein
MGGLTGCVCVCLLKLGWLLPSRRWFIEFVSSCVATPPALFTFIRVLQRWH